MSIRRQLGDLAKSLDSSAVGSFLSKGASEADFTTISYSDVSGTPSVVADSAIATSIIDSAYVSARVTTVAAGLDSATTINLLDSNYMAARSGGGAGFYVYNYDATAGQTTFQDSDASGNVMSYSADGIIVFYNGVMLPTADYTATDGTSVVLGSAADSQDVVTIAKWGVGGGSGGGSSAVWYGDRGIAAGGNTSPVAGNVIEYIDITSTGNSTDFGDLSTSRLQFGASGVSDTTYGVFPNGGSAYNTATNVIDYVTISTTGNATDFGDRTSAILSGSASDGTYGLFAGGYNSSGYNNIDYITIASPANAQDFGDLTRSDWGIAGSNDATRGVFGPGSSNRTIIDYVTIATPGNATDFGDPASAQLMRGGACGDGTYVVFVGGCTSGANNNANNEMSYITVQTTGNASDFGDLTEACVNLSCTSNGSRGVRMGGEDNYGSNQLNTIDYWTIASPGNATDFGDLLNKKVHCTATSGSPS